MMAEINVRVVSNLLPELIQKSPREFGVALRKAAIHGREYAKESMYNSPATGRTYRSGTGRGWHIASSPGNPPRVDTENLVNSIKVERVRRHVQRVYTPIEYGIYLEFGTSKMAARPFFNPMMIEVERRLPSFFSNFLG